jgi:hypothetical protein
MPSDADRIEQTAREEFARPDLKAIMLGNPAALKTDAIKRIFANLGKNLGYRVAASGYADLGWEQWLYDMVWYKDDDATRMLVRIPMVLESELHLGKVANVTDVNPDFQKLIQARAEVRVWLAHFWSEDIARKHLENCKSQAKAFSGSMPGDAYVFILWVSNAEERAGKALIEQFQV